MEILTRTMINIDTIWKIRKLDDSNNTKKEYEIKIIEKKNSEFKAVLVNQNNSESAIVIEVVNDRFIFVKENIVNEAGFVCSLAKEADTGLIRYLGYWISLKEQRGIFEMIFVSKGTA